MNKLKTIGLTALAGSLVAATSVANAGELSVSGGAKISFTSKGGKAQDNTLTGNPFGMEHTIGFSGSGELDNGMTVSLFHDLESDGTAGSTSTISLDMGSMGVLTYGQDGWNPGIAKVDDIMPTAVEEVSNGVSGDANAASYQVDMGGNAFDYVYSFDMGTINFGYSRGNVDTEVNNGGVSGAGASTDSGKSVHVDLNPIDGLRFVAGTGKDGVVDQDTIAAVYSMGPVTVGMQRSDRSDASIDDTEETYASVAFAVNENLSISYGVIETEFDTATQDQESEGFGIGYSMGGITITAHHNTTDDVAGASTDEYEHTELEVTFAF